MNAFCNFCAMSGVAGPHDHYLRSSKNTGAKVVCPKLLATECNYCHKMGHTTKFCQARRDQEMFKKRQANLVKQAMIDNGEWMEIGVPSREHPGFQSPRMTRNKSVSNLQLASRFAALEFTTEDDCIGCESGADCAQAHTQECNTWASVVKTPVAKKHDSLFEELPPLNWGKKTKSSWADEVDNEDSLPQINWN